MGKHVCDICSKTFDTPQALGSHKKYKHGSTSSEAESLDMKEEFENLLKDVGVRNKRKIITDIFFDLGAEDLNNLEYVLNTAGITNPAKRLIMVRWAQRIGKKLSDEMVQDEGGAKEPDTGYDKIFEKYEKILEMKFQEMLLDQMTSGIKEEAQTEDTGIKELVEELRNQRIASVLESSSNNSSNRGFWGMMQKGMRCMVHPWCNMCPNCGAHVFVGNVFPGGMVICPVCGVRFLRE